MAELSSDAELAALIVRLQQEESGSADLDGLIFRATTPGQGEAISLDDPNGDWFCLGGEWIRRNPEDPIAWMHAPRYTAKLDAQLPIEAEGWWEISGPRRFLSPPSPSANRWGVSFMPFEGCRQFVAWGATEALARRAAALMALAAKEPS
jgi:hypothetical protein